MDLFCFILSSQQWKLDLEIKCTVPSSFNILEIISIFWASEEITIYDLQQNSLFDAIYNFEIFAALM